MTNFSRGALWPLATLRFGALAAASLFVQWLLDKGTHFPHWGWSTPRIMEGDVRLYFEWVEAIASGRAPYLDFLVPYPAY